MFIRILPWWMIAMGAVGLVGTGAVAWAQTGDPMLFLAFFGMAVVVAIIAWIKWRWMVQGKTIFGLAGIRFVAALGASEAYAALNPDTIVEGADAAGSLGDLL